MASVSNLDEFGLPVLTQEAIGGAYEGASKTSQEIALWSPPIMSADRDVLPEKQLIDARSLDLVRNDGYIRGTSHIYQDSIVGGQFVLNAKPNLDVLSRINPAFDDKWAEEWQVVVEGMFGLWAESSQNWPDASRINTLTGLVRLAVGIFVYSGEVLATAEWLRSTGRPFSTAIQMVDNDRLTNPDGMMDSPRLRRGIERDMYGAPVAAYIRSGHPTDFTDTNRYTWKRVPFRKPWGRQQVIHIFEQTRPDQSRGISDMVAVLKEMKMTKKFQDITLQNAVINATYAATIESELPPEAAYAQMGMGGASSWAEEYMAQIAQYVSGSKNIHIDGAKIPHLYPGTKLNLQRAGDPGGVGSNFEQSLLRHVAAALGLSYEQFSRDYTNTNYSSARASMMETWKRMQSRKTMVADRFASAIYALWLEEAINKGMVPLPVGVSASVFYEGLAKDALCACSWLGANRGQIDELKETQAAVLRLNSNLSTYEEECARMGKDYRDVIKQRAREQRMMDEFGLSVDLSDSGNTDTKDDETDQQTSTENEK